MMEDILWQRIGDGLGPTQMKGMFSGVQVVEDNLDDLVMTKDVGKRVCPVHEGICDKL